MPPGTRVSIGTAMIEITAVPHNGCDSFIARYGRDACVFVNTGEGRKMRLRGIYARVVEDGVGGTCRRSGTETLTGHLLSRKLGLALLEEGLRAFEVVAGQGRLHEALGLEIERALE